MELAASLPLGLESDSLIAAAWAALVCFLSKRREETILFLHHSMSGRQTFDLSFPMVITSLATGFRMEPKQSFIFQRSSLHLCKHVKTHFHIFPYIPVLVQCTFSACLDQALPQTWRVSTSKHVWIGGICLDANSRF